MCNTYFIQKRKREAREIFKTFIKKFKKMENIRASSARVTISNNAKFNSFIDEILGKFRSTGNSEINYIIWSSMSSFRELDENDKTRFQVLFENHEKIIYDPQRRVFHKKKMYQISRKEELLEEIERSPFGIENNKDLTDCYQGCEKDLKELIDAKAVREIRDLKNKKSIIFPKDPEFDKDFLEKEIPEDFKFSVREEFNKICNDRINAPSEISGDRASQKQKDKKKNKRRNNKIVNVWMVGNINFDDMYLE